MRTAPKCARAEDDGGDDHGQQDAAYTPTTGCLSMTVGFHRSDQAAASVWA
jgi:hypothetical protein